MERGSSDIEVGKPAENEDMDDHDFGLGVNMTESALDHTQILFDVVSKSIKFLFRLGVLIRKPRPVDRFQRALQRSDTIPAWPDINYVRDKYPKLDKHENR
jgi:hypothetical protein